MHDLNRSFFQNWIRTKNVHSFPAISRLGLMTPREIPLDEEDSLLSRSRGISREVRPCVTLSDDFRPYQTDQ